MQGTGTQADPYIPYEWDEVLEAIGASGAYVTFPLGGGEYNLNDIYPTGVPWIRVRCAQIDGNGWTLKNIRCTGSAISTIGTRCVWNDINFLDILHQGGDFFKNNEEFYNDGQAIFNRCRFTGIMSTGSLFVRNTRHGDNVFRLNSCSINIKADNDAILFAVGMDSSYAAVNNCNIKIVGNSNNPFGASYMYNCFVQGEMSPNQDKGIKLVSGSNYNIIVADLSQSASSALLACPNGINLINSDLLPAGTSIPAGMKGCTTEQLKDAGYDASIGFPIGVG